MRIAGGRTGELREAPAGNAPMRHHRRRPAHALARLHHLRAGRCIDDEDDGVGAGILEPRQLRDHVDVVVLEFLDAGDLDRRIGLAGRHQALLVRLAPGIVDEHEPGLLRREFLVRVGEEPHVDQGIHRRDAKGVVGSGAVARDAGARGPHAHVDALLLVEQRHHGQRHRRVDAAEDRHHVGRDEFARGDQALGRVRLVVALHQFEHAAAKEPAFGVDLVDRERQAARDRFTGLRRGARERRHMADLDRVGGMRRRRREYRQRRADRERPGQPGALPLPASAHCFLLSPGGLNS